jgi:hypothetical protein
MFKVMKTPPLNFKLTLLTPFNFLKPCNYPLEFDKQFIKVVLPTRRDLRWPYGAGRGRVDDAKVRMHTFVTSSLSVDLASI